MQFFALGVLLLFFLLIGAKLFVQADPKMLAKGVRWAGAALLLLAAGFFAVTGRVILSVPLLIFALRLFGRRLPFNLPGFGFSGMGQRKSAHQASKVRTSYLEMTLDHDSGSIDGRVLRGDYTDRQLSALSLDELFALHRECGGAGDQSLALLEAYLDAMHDGWRDHESAPGAATGGKGGKSGAAGPSSAMSREEACEVLGLGENPGETEIRRAHKALMKQFHPDHGGSSYLAAKINQAKDVLLADG